MAGTMQSCATWKVTEHKSIYPFESEDQTKAKNPSPLETIEILDLSLCTSMVVNHLSLCTSMVMNHVIDSKAEDVHAYLKQLWW
jgi:hypothetical protein